MGRCVPLRAEPRCACVLYRTLAHPRLLAATRSVLSCFVVVLLRCALPLLLRCALIAVPTTVAQAKWFFERRIRKEAERTGETERELTVYEIMSAGAFAGFVNSVVVGPVELVKCRLQAATTTDVGSWNCAKEIYGTAGSCFAVLSQRLRFVHVA